MKKILFLFGTRPEAIKLAPLIYEIKKDKFFNYKICITSQHKGLLKQALKIFKLKPDFDLNVMMSNQKLSKIISKISTNLSKILDSYKPSLIIVQGDTTSAMLGALIGSMHKIKIAHVEAGLRTFDNKSPFPEEINRNIISKLADYNFCPTRLDIANLRKENIKNIYLTGNTIVDAVNYILKNHIKKKNNKYFLKFRKFLKKKNRVFLTIHRRENFGPNLEKIINTVKLLAKKNISFFIPVHPNPNIKKVIYKKTKNTKNIFLHKPVSFDEGIFLAKNSDIILSDSGGLQEEASILKKKILILRNSTERPMVLKNFGVLVGSNREKIAKLLLNFFKNNKNPIHYASPFGKPGVSKKIIRILKKE